MDIVMICFYYLFKISLYIVVIGWAIAVLFLIYILFKILKLVRLIWEIVEDINQKYFLFEHYFFKPFKFVISLFNKKNK